MLPMFYQQKFTDRARKGIYLAQEEAQRRGNCFVDTGDLLVGVIRGEGVAGTLFKIREVNVGKARAAIEKVDEPPPSSLDQIRQMSPPSFALKQVVEQSWNEANELGRGFIGTEHLILALLRFPDCAGTRALLDCTSASVDEIREQIFSLLRDNVTSVTLLGTTDGELRDIMALLKKRNADDTIKALCAYWREKEGVVKAPNG